MCSCLFRLFPKEKTPVSRTFRVQNLFFTCLTCSRSRVSVFIVFKEHKQRHFRLSDFVLCFVCLILLFALPYGLFHVQNNSKRQQMSWTICHVITDYFGLDCACLDAKRENPKQSLVKDLIVHLTICRTAAFLNSNFLLVLCP